MSPMKRYKSADEYYTSAVAWRAELNVLRKILSETQLEETIKWSAPCYTFDGKNVVGVAGFKTYFGLWFHQGVFLEDKKGVLINAQEGRTKALRQWRMKSGDEIKPRVIKAYIKEAIGHVKSGIEIKPDRKKKVEVPLILKNALAKNKKADSNFAKLTPGRKREFADYISAAKREQTKLSRISKIIPMIVAGEGLNDKYK